jgi:uncharacterized protein (DUF488 family)
MSDLRDDIARGTGVTVGTVGHAHHPFEHYVELLQQHDIALVVDVRSRPYIRHAPHYNREALDPALTERGFEYLYLGEHLGQRPEGDRFYDDEGHTLYGEVAKEPWFLKAIGRVEFEAERQRVVLTCLEEEPERCHRYHLLGKVLCDRGARVLHVRRDGTVESQQEVSQRRGEGQASLFGDAEPQMWRSPDPMRGGHARASADEDDWE